MIVWGHVALAGNLLPFRPETAASGLVGGALAASGVWSSTGADAKLT